MSIDRVLELDSSFAVGLERMGPFARHLEDLGYDGLWTIETPHNPLLPLRAAAASTHRVTLGTGIATAFTRSPMVTALTAWDLQKVSAGRFILGLGTQVKTHNARRYSTPRCSGPSPSSASWCWPCGTSGGR